MQKVRTGMRDKGINIMENIDGEEWRKTKETLGTESCENINTLHINNY